MRRSLFISVTIALLAPTLTLAVPAGSVEFVSGTVKAIPANTAGTLDARSASELSFHYGKSVLSVPYSAITSTEVTEPSSHHIWRVPVPKIGKSERFLNITYREGDKSRMLTFKAPTATVKELVNAIYERRKDPKADTDAATLAARPSVKTDTEAWWGDRYWRTNRNKSKWPQVPGETSTGGGAGSKE